MLGQKQKENNDKFVYVWNNIEKYISKAEVDNKLDYTVETMRPVLNHKRYVVAWSGGKDSVVLDFVTKQLKQEYPSCMGMTKDLEYPEFLKFVTNNMPEDLKVYNSGHSLKWLSENIGWLFPKTSKEASRWFKAVQHKAQDQFVNDKSIEVLLTGRRKKDMNYTGINGIYQNKATGVTRYSPIHDWSHEEVLGCMRYYNLPEAPFYSWRNGFVVGSGNWASRQWTGSIEQGWAEVYEIDKSIVLNASKYIETAKQYVRSLGF
jgi:3'-phosphoadenosine 5'-phosphosulfate sulfotransferase (PAPS reductase)/FAD synthetase